MALSCSITSLRHCFCDVPKGYINISYITINKIFKKFSVIFFTIPNKRCIFAVVKKGLFERRGVMFAPKVLKKTDFASPISAAIGKSEMIE